MVALSSAAMDNFTLPDRPLTKLSVSNELYGILFVVSLCIITISILAFKYYILHFIARNG